jgi:hypothetical protein
MPSEIEKIVYSRLFPTLTLDPTPMTKIRFESCPNVGRKEAGTVVLSSLISSFFMCWRLLAGAKLHAVAGNGVVGLTGTAAFGMVGFI